MIIHDISLTVTPKTITWDGVELGFSSLWTSRIGPGSECNVSLLTVGAHTGTHLDAPLHFVAQGGDIAGLDLTTLVGPAQLVEILGTREITPADLEAAGIGEDIVRVIFKTDNTQRRLVHDTRFHTDYTGVGPEAAEWLVARGIKLVGVDYLSVGVYGDKNTVTHQTLLGAGVVILETLALDSVSPGRYLLAALPPKFADIEGSSCRAILIEE
ncbi:polyketide cyclase [Capsulimonas corticalis]|uniref:Kynurenine formamidase n=1 Tax=Capsulimonas corticalis TaxID=2219043 RepID=A0A402CPX5_9BACT|nr:cyclase family protein [Capsulimonas corticalis]BDI32914.1 polyketide cyclase [Capsulimonas corticalis]